ncbi:tellurite resistance TerB family protein [Nocardia beijingensis]|uniref:TerB family tellurite resistance protein n=1 Tax=Nocardia beijingensis TaxID=95162 RepID=UPI001893DC1D|nr:TerB family tellurite resistance protein [Nocardia beijingensis]MBF6467570.1 tellurite resistance TerB family protein [Nocardia beijingensis]
MTFAPRRSPDATLIHTAETAATWRAELLAQRNALRGANFRDAAVALCALMAVADGAAAARDHALVAELVTTDPVLRNFPVDDLRALFEDNRNRLTNDPVLGCAHVLRQIAKAGAEPTEADAVIRTGILIGSGAGACGQAATDALRDACRALRLAPERFGL